MTILTGSLADEFQIGDFGIAYQFRENDEYSL